MLAEELFASQRQLQHSVVGRFHSGTMASTSVRDMILMVTVVLGTYCVY